MTVDEPAPHPLDVDARIRRLLDRQDILDCIERGARGMDRHDAELIASAFHPGAIDDHGTYRGTAAGFIDYVNGHGDNPGAHAAQFLVHQHFVVNHSVELDGDDAHSETYFLFVGEVRGEPQISINGGRYIDHLTRRDGRWGIVTRRVVMEWVSQMPLANDFVSDRLQLFTRGTWDREDVSYQRPLYARTSTSE